MNLKSQNKGSFAGSLALFTAALVWGLAFVAQRYGAALIDSISLNVMRFVIGSVLLAVVIAVIDFIKIKRNIDVIRFNRDTFIGGTLCGAILFVATFIQQLGIETTSAGKAGFITALYIVFVPVLGLAARRKTPMSGWFAIVIAIAGFWTMSVGDGFTINSGDALIFLCAIIFSFQILFIDLYSPSCDAVKFTFVQFTAGAIIGLPIMAANGFPSWETLQASAIPLLYMGIMSSGVAYTLQVVGQQRVAPATATLIMSLESIFALIGGALILSESFSTQEVAGCIFVFIGVFLAEWKLPRTFLKFNKPSRWFI